MNFGRASGLASYVAKSFFSAALLCSNPSAAFSQANAGSLTGADLIDAAQPVRIFRQKDQFEAAPRVDMSGRSFAVEIAARTANSGGCVSLPFWRYHAESGMLELTFFGDRRSGYFLRGYDGKVHPVLSDAGSYQTAPIKCIETARGSYRASNAFGATTTIWRYEQFVVEVAAARPLGTTEGTDFMMTSIKMTASDAKQIAPTLRVKYEGRLAKWDNGSSVACGVEHMDADMREVRDTTVDTCIFRGDIERIAFIDGRSGAVLAERKFPNTIGE